MPAAAPPTRVPLADGRHLAVDDVGARDGHPVVFLHGSPSCRLGRPPLDAEVAAAGVRLLAPDRPGIGRSDPDPHATASTFARDLAAALDHLRVERVDIVAWSAGALAALAAAADADLGPRIGRVTIAAGLVPAEAFEDPVVREHATASRGGMLDTVAELGATETAALVAPMMVPFPCSLDDARTHLEAIRGPAEAAEIAAVPGGADQAAASLVEAVRQGLDGTERDLVVQLSPLGVDLGLVAGPVRLVYGSADDICPPAFGEWLHTNLANAELHTLPGASHGLPFPHWIALLTDSPIVGEDLRRPPRPG